MDDLRFAVMPMHVDRTALQQRSDGDTRIPISISSEYPVERYDWTTGERYLEILSHAPDAVDLSRAVRGLALVDSHDTREHLGLVQDMKVDPDRVLRGMVRPSRMSKAQDVARDMEDEIRPFISVGYRTFGDPVVTRTEDGTRVETYTRWMPYEVSTVAVPADPSVGVNRSAPAGRPSSPTSAPPARSEPMDPVATGAPAVVPTPSPVAVLDERSMTIYDLAAAHGLDTREANELVRSQKSVREIGVELASRKAAAPAPALPDLDPTERKQFSLFRALHAHLTKDWREAGYERECIERVKQRMNRDTSGVYLPTTLETRSQLSFAAGAGKGTEARETQVNTIIDLLRAQSLALGSLGVRRVAMTGGNQQFPRQTGTVTASMVAEAPGSDLALSSATIEQFTMSPRAAQASTTISRQMILQTDMEQFAIDDIVEAHRVLVDRIILAGTGTGQEPAGFLNAAGVNLIAYGTNGAQPTLALLESHRVAIENANGVTDNMRWVFTPAIASRLRQTVAYASTASPLWNWMGGDDVLGFPAYATTNLPSNLTKGTANGICHGVLAGDFSQGLYADWQAMEIIVDEFTLARRNLVQLTSIQFFDFAVRRPSVIAVSRDALV